MKAAPLARENEGGAPISPPSLEVTGRPTLRGTANQIEWAQSIRAQVNAEFDRVAASFRSIADRQGDNKRTETEAVIPILEGKRAEVIRKEEAGYFIHDWQEIRDQVRQTIFRDARYQVLKAKRGHR